MWQGSRLVQVPAFQQAAPLHFCSVHRAAWLVTGGWQNKIGRQPFVLERTAILADC